MTAATFSARPVAAQRIGLVTAWKVERAKVRRSWFLGGAVILSIFAQLLGVWNYTSNLAIMQEQGLTWFGVWAQGAILVTSIFLPILYGVILAQAGALEHQTRGWQRLASIDRAGTAVSGKMLVALELALTGMAVYLVTAVAAGLFLGFDPSQLGPYLARALCGALGAWAVGAVTLMLGTWLRTFAAIDLGRNSARILFQVVLRSVETRLDVCCGIVLELEITAHLLPHPLPGATARAALAHPDKSRRKTELRPARPAAPCGTAPTAGVVPYTSPNGPEPCRPAALHGHRAYDAARPQHPTC